MRRDRPSSTPGGRVLPESDQRPRILLHVGETLRVGARSGIPRVVLKLATELASRARLDLVRWDALEGRLRFVDREEFDHLFGRGSWPDGLNPRPDARRLRVRFGDMVTDSSDVWLLYPEVPYHSPHGLQAFATGLSQAREYGWRTAVVFYDMIPATNPAYAAERPEHLRYLAELTRADLLVPISQHSADQLGDFMGARGLETAAVAPVPLGEADQPRASTAENGDSAILVLGTVEPRKHQLDVVRAYAKGRATSRALASMELVIVGSLHPSVARPFEALVARTPGARYCAYLPEADLATAWRRAAFSVFASDDEGFGLPVAESLANGLPCIVVDKPPMTAIAAGAGLRRVAAPDPDLLCDAMVTLAETPAERTRLREQIAGRRLRTWGDYARDLLTALATARRPREASRAPVVRSAADPLIEQAGADIVFFPDAVSRDSFVDRCAREGVAPALPSRLVVPGDPDPLPALRAFRSRLSEIARAERRHGAALRSLGDAVQNRAVFLRIVISTYNRRPFVLENVKWLLQQVIKDRTDIELVVVDNASTDGSGAALREAFRGQRVRIIENSANVGMLGNMRVCSQIPGAEYVWLIGDDDFIVPSQVDTILTALRGNLGVSLAYLNFAVYYRRELEPLDTVESLQKEGRALASGGLDTGVHPLRTVAEPHDNLFTAIYINIWRADVLAAAYDHPFEGKPFSNLVESIPCTKTLLESFGECDALWVAPAAIVGNAHNSWVRHRPRWHGRLMPEALALARDAGVDPLILQPWADHQARLYDEACELAREAGRGLDMDEPGACDPSWPLFRRRLTPAAAR